uniref:Uncharacterized protein n=1 Tax=Tetranychus urticae TaxID=32264 RepID=T1KXT9_TETUR
MEQREEQTSKSPSPINKLYNTM